MKAIHTIVSLFAVTLSLGCNHEERAPGATTATAGTAAVSTDSRGARHEGGGDPTNALLRATSNIQLTDAQKATIHALEEQLEANEKDTGAAFKATRGDLAAQVRTGSIDNAKVQGDESAATTALRNHIAKEAETLNGLHAALDPSQRAAVVAAVRANQPVRSGGATASEPAADETAKRRIDRLTRELGLDAAQQQQVASILSAQPAPARAQGGERHQRMDVLLNAFTGDSFDAKTALPPPPVSPADMIRDRIDRQATFLSKLLPILRPDQREKLAASIDRGDIERGHDDDD